MNYRLYKRCVNNLLFRYLHSYNKRISKTDSESFFFIETKDNTILVCRLAMCLICAFLRMVWGGGKGEGYSPSVRASTQPDKTVGTVRFRTQYLKNFSCSKYLLCPFQRNKGALVWLLWVIFISEASSMTQLVRPSVYRSQLFIHSGYLESRHSRNTKQFTMSNFC